MNWKTIFTAFLCIAAMQLPAAAEVGLYELEERADKFYYWGSETIENENWEYAVRYLAQAISIYTYIKDQTTDEEDLEYYEDTLFECYGMIVKGLRNRGGFRRARSAYEKLLEMHEARLKEKPRDVDVLVAAAQSYEEAAEGADVHSLIQWRERALKLRNSDNAPENPDSKWAQFESHAALGAAKAKEEDFVGAEAHYTKARTLGDDLLEKYPGNLDWIEEHSGIYERFGDLEIKRKNYDGALSMYRKAIRLAKNGRKIAPDNQLNRWIGIEVYYRNEAGSAIFYDCRYDDAADEFARAAELKNELQPGSDKWPRGVISRSHALRAYSLCSTNWDGVRAAELEYTQAIEILEEIEEHSQLKSYMGRRETIQQLLELKGAYNDSDPGTWFELADKITRVKNLPLSDLLKNEAVELFEKIPEESVVYGRAILGRSEIAQNNEDFELALEFVEKCHPILEKQLENDPNEETAEWAWKAQMQSSQILIQIDEGMDEIKPFALRAIEIAEKNQLSLKRRRISHQLLTSVYNELDEHQATYKSQLKTLELSEEYYRPILDQLDSRYQLAGAYGNLCWHALFVREFDKAIEAGRAGLEVKYELWIAGNMAHGYLLADEYEKALKIYKRHVGEPIREGEDELWEEIVKIDFDELREAGIEHPDMEKVERELGL